MALLVDNLAKLKEISASLGQTEGRIASHLNGGGSEDDEDVQGWRVEIGRLRPLFQ